MEHIETLLDKYDFFQLSISHTVKEENEETSKYLKQFQNTKREENKHRDTNISTSFFTVLEKGNNVKVKDSVIHRDDLETVPNRWIRKYFDFLLFVSLLTCLPVIGNTIKVYNVSFMAH